MSYSFEPVKDFDLSSHTYSFPSHASMVVTDSSSTSITFQLPWHPLGMRANTSDSSLEIGRVHFPTKFSLACKMTGNSYITLTQSGSGAIMVIGTEDLRDLRSAPTIITVDLGVRPVEIYADSYYLILTSYGDAPEELGTYEGMTIAADN